MDSTRGPIPPPTPTPPPPVRVTSALRPRLSPLPMLAFDPATIPGLIDGGGSHFRRGAFLMRDVTAAAAAARTCGASSFSMIDTKPPGSTGDSFAAEET